MEGFGTEELFGECPEFQQQVIEAKPFQVQCHNWPGLVRSMGIVIDGVGLLIRRFVCLEADKDTG